MLLHPPLVLLSHGLNCIEFVIYSKMIQSLIVRHKAMEAIQRALSYKVTELEHLNYSERLHQLKLYYLQRRRDRYINIYVCIYICVYMYRVPNKQKTSIIP